MDKKNRNKKMWPLKCGVTEGFLKLGESIKFLINLKTNSWVNFFTQLKPAAMSLLAESS